MNKRIKDKTKDIEKYIEQSSLIKPKTFKEYKGDFKTKAACERYFEKIAEAVIDLAFLVMKDRSLPIPEEEHQIFDVLEGEEIINSDLAKRLKDMKGMRNVIAHQYAEVNDEIMFIAITEELENDVTLFLTAVRKSDKKRDS